jgi:predicted phage gp36 major capsid-like protein
MANKYAYAVSGSDDGIIAICSSLPKAYREAARYCDNTIDNIRSSKMADGSVWYWELDGVYGSAEIEKFYLD